MKIMPPQSELLTALLDIAHVRHAVLAGNIANVNTPGYRRREVDFERSLRNLLASSGAREGVVVNEEETPGRTDGNNVDLDQELAQLLQNALIYQVASQIMTVRLGMIRRALGSNA